ncbi:hypothetical protein [Streptomyces sp. NPDC050485]|uniref:hypothetical protein n=1 Tax=Streptomyces sp. NPDC050485 TaxID=3365617 RepID=UPI0037A043E3
MPKNRIVAAAARAIVPVPAAGSRNRSPGLRSVEKKMSAMWLAEAAGVKNSPVDCRSL